MAENPSDLEEKSILADVFSDEPVGASEARSFKVQGLAETLAPTWK